MAKEKQVVDFTSSNFKYLRKTVFKEKQEVVAELLSVSRPTISGYETGASPIPQESLEILAYHYRVLLDDFKYKDLRKEDLSEFFNGILDKQKVFSVMNGLFPFIGIDENQEDSFFMEGYNSFIQIQRGIIIGKELDFEQVVDCLVNFKVSWELYKNLSSIINYVSIVFGISLGIENASNNLFDVVSVIMGKKEWNYIDIQKIYLRPKPDNLERLFKLSNRKSFVNDNKDTIMTYIRVLKESPEYCDIADFFLANRYLVGFVENEFDMELNQKIWIELIDTLRCIGNKCVLEFLKKLE